MNRASKGIQLRILSGNFTSAIDTLSIAVELLDNEQIVQIISCCNSICVEHLKNEVSLKQLLRVLMLCGSGLVNLDERLSNEYVESIYSILEYLAAKDDATSIISLENLLIPQYVNFESESVKKLYSKISKLMYNTSMNLYTTDDVKASHLFLISVKLLYKITPLDQLLEEKVHDYLNVYSRLNIRFTTHYNCLCNLFKLLSEEEIKNNFKSIGNILIVITDNFFKDDKFVLLILILIQLRNAFTDIKIDENSINLLTQLIKLINGNFPTKESLLETLSEHIKTLQSHSVSYTSQVVCMLGCNIISNLVKQPMQYTLNFTIYKDDPDVQFMLYKLIKIIGYVFTTDHFSSTCSSQKDYVSAIYSTLLAARILNDCLTTAVVSEECVIEAGKCLEESFLYVNKLKMTDFNWQLHWQQVGTVLKNLCVYLSDHKSMFCPYYMKILIRNCVSIEGIDGDIVEKNFLHSCLLHLSDYYFNGKDFENALIISALNTSLYPNVREKPFKQWVRIKEAVQISEVEEVNLLQQYNLSSILKKHQAYVRRIYDDFVLKDVEDLLLFEIKQYKAIWPDDVSLTSACKELFTNSNTITTTKALLTAWGDSVSIISDDAKDILNEIIEKLELEENPENNICLGCLYYIKYHSFYERNKYLDMNIHNSFSNDEWDISYPHERLKLDVFTEVIKYLNKSLDIFKKCINVTTLDLSKSMNISDLLIKIANEYRLHCCTLECLQTWSLCLQLAQMLNDNVLIVKCAGFIVENGKINSVFVKDLINEIEDKIVIMEENCNSDTIWKTLTSYRICLGSAYLKAEDVKTSLSHYTTAVKFYNNISEDDRVLKIRLDFLNWQHMVVPCGFKTRGHKDFFGKLNTIVDNITKLCFEQAGACCSYITSLLFEIHQSTAHYYLWLRLPEEVRRYCRNITCLAQKLIIPFQAVIFLGYLAQADLMYCRFDDCKIKIEDLRKILCLSRQHNTEILTEETTKDNMDGDRKCNAKLPSSTMIDSFINHDDDCSCFQCMSLPYKQLVLMEMNLQAQLHVTSQEYYKSALSMYEQIVAKLDKFNEKVYKVLNNDILPDPADVLLEIHCTILLNFAKILKGKERKTTLQEITKSLRIKYVNSYLYNEAHMLLLEVLKFPVTPVGKLQNSVHSITAESDITRTNIIPTGIQLGRHIKIVSKSSDTADKTDKDSSIVSQKKKTSSETECSKMVIQLKSRKKLFTEKGESSSEEKPLKEVSKIDTDLECSKMGIQIRARKKLFTEKGERSSEEKPLKEVSQIKTENNPESSKMGIQLRSRKKSFTEKGETSSEEKPIKKVSKSVVSNKDGDTENANKRLKTTRRISTKEATTTTSLNLQENVSGKNKGAVRKSTRNIKKK